MTVIGDLPDLIGRYGYLVILFGVMAESAGVPLPGETVLIVSGALAHRGILDLGYVLFFGALGAVTGDQMGYWVGRKGGRSFVLRWGRHLWLTGERLESAQSFFDRHGGRAVFFARFITGFRVFGALAAGTSRMPWGRFALYNALGGAVWTTVVVSLGYLLWASLSLVEHWVGRASLLLVALLALILVLRWAYRKATGSDVPGNDQPGDRTP